MVYSLYGLTPEEIAIVEGIQDCWLMVKKKKVCL